MTQTQTYQVRDEAEPTDVAAYCKRVNRHFRGLPPLTGDTVRLVALHYLRVPRELLSAAIAEVPIAASEDGLKLRRGGVSWVRDGASARSGRATRRES